MLRITCCLLLDLLLQSDSRLKLGVDAGRNDGRGEVSQVGQDTLTQGTHVPLAQLALWKPNTTFKDSRGEGKSPKNSEKPADC